MSAMQTDIYDLMYPYPPMYTPVNQLHPPALPAAPFRPLLIIVLGAAIQLELAERPASRRY